MVNWIKAVVAAATGQNITPDNHRAVHDSLQGNVNQLRTLADAREAMRPKMPVRCASTANVAASALVPGGVLDGVTLAAGDRVLIKNNTAGYENGIFDIKASGAPTRSTDADTPIELSGAIVAVMEGTQAGQAFSQIEPMPILGSTSLIWLRAVSTVSVSQSVYDSLPSSLKQPGAGTIFAVTG